MRPGKRVGHPVAMERRHDPVPSTVPKVHIGGDFLETKPPRGGKDPQLVGVASYTPVQRLGQRTCDCFLDFDSGEYITVRRIQTARDQSDN